MGDGEGPILKWPIQDEGDGSINILIVGGSRMEDLLIQSLLENVDREADLAESTGRPVLDIGVLKTLTLDEDLSETSKKRVDYILLILNPADASCLDRAELEFSRIDAMFQARHRVELCFARVSGTETYLSAVQLKTFAERYQNPAMSTIWFDNEEAIKFEASKLFKRLKHIKVSRNTGLV